MQHFGVECKEPEKPAVPLFASTRNEVADMTNRIVAPDLIHQPRQPNGPSF